MAKIGMKSSKISAMTAIKHKRCCRNGAEKTMAKNERNKASISMAREKHNEQIAAARKWRNQAAAWRKPQKKKKKCSMKRRKRRQSSGSSIGIKRMKMTKQQRQPSAKSESGSNQKRKHQRQSISRKWARRYHKAATMAAWHQSSSGIKWRMCIVLWLFCHSIVMAHNQHKRKSYGGVTKNKWRGIRRRNHHQAHHQRQSINGGERHAW